MSVPGILEGSSEIFLHAECLKPNQVQIITILHETAQSSFHETFQMLTY